MKKKLKTKIMQCLFLMMGAMVLLTSCHSDDDVEPAPAPAPEVAKPTTYTIMLYGCGGGNLDAELVYNLDQLAAHGKTDRINFAGLIKFSKERQDMANMDGTRLFTLTSEGLKNEKAYEASYRMDNPAHLTQFIKDTKESMPADKYILIFWNHGEEFGLHDKLPLDADYTEQSGSRSILFDDNVDDYLSQSLSVYEIEKGIKDSGTKMDLIYMDLCNYGMAEVYYQLRDCSRYLMAASAPTPVIGGNYSELIEALQVNDSLEDAIKEYVPNCIKNWKNYDVDQQDLECYDLSYMDEFASYMKGAVNEFKKTFKEAAGMQKSLNENYDGVVCIDFYGKFVKNSDDLHIFDGQNYSVDVCSAFSRIANYTLNGTMSHYTTQMKRTLDKMTVARAAVYLPSWMDNVSMGLVWPTTSFYNWYSNSSICMLEDNLKHAELYQATGWGDLIANLRIPEYYKVVSPQENDVYVSSVYKSHRNYIWQYDVEPDLSNIEDAESAQQLYILCKIWARIMNSKAEEHPCILGLGKYIFDEAKNYLSEPVFGNDSPLLTEVLNYYEVNKLQLKVYVKDGVSPDDPDQNYFPAEISEEIEIDE